MVELETQEVPQVVAGDELDAFKLALELQLDLLEARELLEICFHFFLESRTKEEKQLVEMIREFLDRTK